MPIRLMFASWPATLRQPTTNGLISNQDDDVEGTMNFGTYTEQFSAEENTDPYVEECAVL